MLLLVTLAVQIKRRRMLTLFPTLLLAVQLCIGKSPSVSEVVMLTLCTLWCLIADGNARTVAGYDVNGSEHGNDVFRIAQAFLYMAAVSAILLYVYFRLNLLLIHLPIKAADACLSKRFGGQRKIILQLGN